MTGSSNSGRLAKPGGEKRGAGTIWLAIQLASPFVFAGFIMLAMWGGYRPSLTSAEDVFWHLMVCVTVALAYIAIQGFAVVLQPVGSDVRPLLDVLTSLAPALVIAFAAERSISGYMSFDFYQQGVLWISGLAALIDLTCFTLFAMKVNRLAPDVVVTS
ncbi:MAG: hypothetical protein SFW09_23495 [Hyphomicrobiaceae bacterium]|nr:hypothetical protein [Hyphomicrobiaceae bacterium]